MAEETTEENDDNKIGSLSLVFPFEINKKFVGTLVYLSDNDAEVNITTVKEMCIDEHGLIYSPFIMAACEYAAMAVINKENLFVQSVEAEYLAPIEVGSKCVIKAKAKYIGDKKKIVSVQAFHKDIKVFDGTFNLLELEQHILEIKLNEQLDTD